MHPLKSSGKLAERVEVIDATETLVERRTYAGKRFSLLDDIVIARGDKSDWELLHELHYKAEGEPYGPHYYKATLHGETIGVIVVAMPRGLLKERHIVFPLMKPASGATKIINTQRYIYLNANFRIISRFVFDTMFRGIGAGYRMMNLVSRMEGINYMEIQSSMSKFNHFGQHAGFRFVKPTVSNKFEQGMRFFREHYGANPQDFEAILEEIAARSPTEREKLIDATRLFYLRNSAIEKTGNKRFKAQSRVYDMPVRELVKQLQQMILASPMYGVYVNPDRGRILPDELPLTAFDRQAPNQPLIW